MNPLPLMLLALTGLACAAPSQASGGTVRFSCRVAEPPCSARLAAAQADILLERCPSAAQGAELSVRALETDVAVTLVGPGGPAGAQRLAAGPAQAGQRWFSGQYRLVAANGATPRPGAYLVRVDYP